MGNGLSLETCPPSSVCVNPRKRWGNEGPLRPGEGGGWSELLRPPAGAWPECEDPSGGEGRDDSAATGRSHTGPLGLHLVSLAPSSPAAAAGLGLWLETTGRCWLPSPKRSFVSRCGASHC